MPPTSSERPTYDEVVQAIRSEVSGYYDGDYRDDDHFVHDLRIASDDLSAVALSLEQRFGRRLAHSDYQRIFSVNSYAAILHARLADPPTSGHRALWTVQLATAVALVALVYLSVKGWLTPRQFGIGGLIVLVATCVALTTAFVRRRTTSPRSWPKPHGSRRAKYLKIAAILLYWIAALWLAREGPVSAKLVGSFMLMLFLIATIVRPARSDRD